MHHQHHMVPYRSPAYMPSYPPTAWQAPTAPSVQHSQSGNAINRTVEAVAVGGMVTSAHVHNQRHSHDVHSVHPQQPLSYGYDKPIMSHTAGTFLYQYMKSAFSLVTRRRILKIQLIPIPA